MRAPITLRNFRVKNYKSCLDSGVCWLSPRITILAGKNESGKTAILEGLEKLYNRAEIPRRDYCNKADEDARPTATVNVLIDETFLGNRSINAHLWLKDAFTSQLTTDGLDLQFTAGEEMTASIPPNVFAIEEHARQALADSATLLNRLYHENGLPSLPPLEHLPREVGAIAALINGQQQLVNETRGSDADKAEMIAQLEALGTALIAQPAEQELKDRFIEEIRAALPSMIFFRDEYDLIPYRTPLDEALTSPAIVRLARAARLDLQRLKDTGDVQARIDMVAGSTAQITGAFEKSWLQDPVSIRFLIYGNELIVSFSDIPDQRSKSYAMDQRSKGFQWYVSFYSRLRDEVIQGAVILIDEPGLFLHAKAQANLLNELENATESQVIYTTHSPYMIPSRNIDRVRTVVKQNELTTIQNKIHADADIETLTPILTAIGDDMGFGINTIGQKPNVVLEGASDRFQLQAMARLIFGSENAADYHYIGCVGAPNIPLVCSILDGWGLPYLAIFDHDTEGKKHYKKMQGKYVAHAPCIYVSKTDGQTIEDLFSRKFFLQYVSPGTDLPGESNGALLKKRGDPVLQSRKFLDAASESGDSIEVDQETKRSFEDLFTRIREAIAAGRS